MPQRFVTQCFAVVAIWLLAGIGDANACACDAKLPQQRIDDAEHIFIARVDVIEREGPEETILHLTDVYPLIGPGEKTIVVDNRNCPTRITQNHYYVFYAKEEDGAVKTDVCMGIRKSSFFPKELCLIDQRRGASHDCRQF